MAATPTSTTQALRSHLAQVFAQYPIEVAHGDGVWLHARDGRKILDFYGGHAVAGLGYGHPRWLAALERQARQMAFQTNALPMAVRERAAARLTKFAGLGLDTVFWINSGAEANENALKLAFKITGRSKAVALEQGWHGRTAAAGAVTWGALEKWYGFPRRPFDVSFCAARQSRGGGRVRGPRYGRGHRRTGAGRRRRVRRRQTHAAGIAATLRRRRCAADIRRGSMRHGSYRHTVRREFLWRDPAWASCGQCVHLDLMC